MRTVSVDQLIGMLRDRRDADFTCEGVHALLAENPVDAGSIERFLFWSKDFYTRNLIYKDERFEMMAICWEEGQVSRVHNHADQQCWMTVPVGKLMCQNFAIESIDEAAGHCRLGETDRFELRPDAPAKVELDEPVHQILNLDEYGARAVSLHIYSKPFDTCLSYCRDTDTFKSVRLHYTSVDGTLCDGVSL